ncbi:phosphoribosylglycinamide formyltransferase [Rhodohalobacter mucosus]|uniref:Phosphoribosylglycinamide formyltransferase n=1 Tax=Rhodohalobacter mucosus TaxID=2079485 RepID=A0A316TKT4_9BACT|nr:phosphoribosylglycinamide formyltransferase [Rhodohalobacter mucosus]PWN05163.1 phosphoribosylglycinamide formyltransferase [Rhodohalobacter mucosus]
MKNIVVMASGSGSNFQAIIDAIQSGRIKQANIAGLVAGKAGIRAAERAQSAGIPVKTMDPSLPHKKSENQLEEYLESWEPDLIILAGFMKKIPDKIVRKYHNRIINIHPSLLPKYGGKGFYGSRVHSAVLEAGDPESGCTVHFVNEQYDRGDIISQVRVPVKPDDTAETLSKRVLEKEHQLLPEVINQLLNPNSN